MVTRAASEPTICLPGELDDLQMRRSAELVFDAGRGYYDLIGAERAVVEAQIAKQIGQSGTELENVFVVLFDSEVAGLHACVSSEVLSYVMMEGSLRLIRGFDRTVRRAFLARLKQARPALPSLPERSLYLARMAVADGFRGCGIAKLLMEDFFRRRSYETSYCLHVLKENASAVRFYSRLGFESFGEERSGFQAMSRPADEVDGARGV